LAINQITVGLKTGNVNIRYSKNNTPKLYFYKALQKEF